MEWGVASFIISILRFAYDLFLTWPRARNRWIELNPDWETAGTLLMLTSILYLGLYSILYLLIPNLAKDIGTVVVFAFFLGTNLVIALRLKKRIGFPAAVQYFSVIAFLFARISLEFFQ